MGMILRAPALARHLHTLTPLAEPALASPGTVDGAEPAGAAVIIDAADARQAALQAEETAAAARGHAEGLARGHAEGLAQGRIDGVAQGREEAARAAQEEAAQRLDHLDALTRRLSALRAEVLAAAEDDVVLIAFEAIGRLVGEVTGTREGVVLQVRTLLAQVAEQDEALRVRLHPRDLALVQRDDPPVTRRPIRWIADESIEAGGCVVESLSGTLEARLEHSLQAISAALRDARRLQSLSVEGE